MKTHWLRRLLWLAGFGCLWINAVDDPPLHTGAYLQDVTATAATVAKICAGPEDCRLVVRDAAGAVVAEQQSLGRRRHALRIEGLAPATRYDYSLTTESGGEETGTLRTAPDRDDATVRFAFVGDSGGQPWWVWLQRTPLFHLPARWHWLPAASTVTAVGAALADYGPDFALHLGDVIYPSGRQAHYSTGFFRPFERLLRGSPVYVVVGNHDMMDAAGQQVLRNFHMPPSDATGDGRCSAFVWGALRVIVLDCNTQYAGDVFDAGHPTYEFLLAQLQAASEPWIVVASHAPIRSASRQRNRGDLMLSLLPVLEQHEVSLYVSGHDHCYQRFGPGPKVPVPLVVSGGGGKSLYEVRPGEGATVLASAYHWCSVELAPRRMRVVAKGLDGAEIDAFELALPTGERLERLRQRSPGRAARIDALVGR